jgi:2-acylglycerol O-acyltransferase 2
MTVKIQFVPKSIPMERRLQTLVIVFYTMLFTLTPIIVAYLFIFLLFTPLMFVPLGYAAWIFYDYRIRKTSSRGGGGRRWEALRHHKIWCYFRDFFPVELRKTAELSPDRNYLFGYHPHGIIGCGAFANFASEATGFSRLFPGIRPHILTLKPNFRYPLIRGFLLWMGEFDSHWIICRQGRLSP